MSHTPITLFTGTVPNRTQSANDFATNADDWLAYQAPLAAEYNALADAVDTEAATADAAAVSAAAAALASASSANFKGEWSTLAGALNIPASVVHNGTSWQLINNLADVTASEPGVTSDWIALNGEQWISRSANFNVAGATLYLIDASSGTVDGTLPTSGVVGTVVTAHNLSTSTNLVQLINTSLTINGPAGTIAAGTDVELDPGDTFHFVFVTSTTLEAV